MDFYISTTDDKYIQNEYLNKNTNTKSYLIITNLSLDEKVIKVILKRDENYNPEYKKWKNVIKDIKQYFPVCIDYFNFSEEKIRKFKKKYGEDKIYYHLDKTYYLVDQQREDYKSLTERWNDMDIFGINNEENNNEDTNIEIYKEFKNLIKSIEVIDTIITFDYNNKLNNLLNEIPNENINLEKIYYDKSYIKDNIINNLKENYSCIFKNNKKLKILIEKKNSKNLLKLNINKENIKLKLFDKNNLKNTIFKFSDFINKYKSLIENKDTKYSNIKSIYKELSSSYTKNKLSNNFRKLNLINTN